MLVQPFDGLPVFITSSLNNPYHHRSVLAGGVGNDLAKVVVVCVLQLVLNDDLTSGSFFRCI